MRYSWHWTGVGNFRNANERSAKAESVGDDSIEDGESQCSQACPGHAATKRIGSSAPKSSPYSQERNTRQHCDAMSICYREPRKPIGHGKDPGQQRLKPEDSEQARQQ